MKVDNIPAWIGTSIASILSVASVEEISRVILLIVGIVSGLFSLAYNVYCWLKRAKADGKITKEELQEGFDIVKDGVDNLPKGDK